MHRNPVPLLSVLAVALMAACFFTPGTDESSVMNDGGPDGVGDDPAVPGGAEVVPLRGGPAWFGEASGTWVDLGFRIGGMTRAKVTMRRSLAGGRDVMSLDLPSGDDLFVARRGEVWEGRVIPSAGGPGWRIEGDAERAEIRRVPRGALICATTGRDGAEVGGLPPVRGLVAESAPAPPVAEAPVVLNSLPDANGVIYLDFDGETVSGTQWNSSFTNGGDIVAGAAGFSNAQVEEVWKGVAEDYRPFNVNVTTDRAVFDAAPTNRRAMLIFTPDNEWYGAAGGVAYVDVFGSSTFDAPGWVFTDQIGDDAANSAEAASHEAGHMLGLRHDGTSSAGYYEGHGDWAPIMGLGYYKPVTHWSRGEYPDANNFEDDLAIISNSRNGLGYRTDDHFGLPGGATALIETAPDVLEGGGVIERGSDVDVFSFQTSGGGVSVTVGNAGYDPNLDVRLRLLGSGGSEIAVSDTDSSLDASLTATVASGSYHVEVSGTGAGDLVTGYGDYGSLGDYAVSVIAPQTFDLAAEIVSPAAPRLSVTEGTGLILDGVVTGGTGQWEFVSGPAGAIPVFSSPMASATRVSFPATGTYRLRLRVVSGTDQVVDELEVAVDPVGAAPTFPERAPAVDLGADREIYADRVTLAPEVTDDAPAATLAHAWTVLSGAGQLSSPTDPAPELVFPEADQPVRLRLVVDDGANRSFDEVGLTARYRQETLIGGTAAAAARVPTDGGLGTDWRSPAFDDSNWTTGALGAGFDATRGPDRRRILQPLVGADLDLEAAMYDRAAGCYLRVPFEVDDAARVLSMVLRLKFDDGFVAYLNGTEIARANVPDGAPSWDTRALTDRFDEDALSAVTFPVALTDGLVVSGTNVLALHGMNLEIAKKERRFLLAPELVAVTADEPPVVTLTPFERAVSTITRESLRAPEADGDGDGRSNLLEHGAGTAVTEPDAGYRMIEMDASGGAALTLPAAPPADVRYLLEHTPDFAGSWQTFAARTGSGPWSGTPPDTTAADIGARERHVFPPVGKDDGFFRLRMELAAP